MSIKKKSTPLARPSRTPSSRTQWKGNLPVELLAEIKDLAEEDERDINVTVVRLLNYALYCLKNPGQTPVHALPTASRVPKVMTDAYTRKQQGAPTVPAPPKNALAEIAESEEGWEDGSNPKTFLGGTKVTI